MSFTLADFSFSEWVSGGGGLTAASLLAIGPMTGWLIDLTARIRHDLVEREVAEKALIESEERFWLSDLDARKVLHVNPAFEEITGWDREQLYAKPASWVNFVHPDDRAPVVANFENIRAGRVSKADGSARWIRSRSFPIPDDNGHIYRVAGVVEDVTDRKAADQSLERTLEDLSISNQVLEKEIEE